MSPAETHGPESEAESSHGEPPPDEPQTPMWLPLVGAALFLLLIGLFVVTRPAGKTKAELAKEAAAAASAASSASANAQKPAPPLAPAPAPAAPRPHAQPHFRLVHPLRAPRPVPPH